jgi:ABC-2 type transport system ATP-binding protein
VRTGEDLVVTLRLDSPEALGVKVCIGLSEGTASPAILVHRNLHLGAGETEVRCTLAHLPLPRGRWYVWLGVFAKHRELLAWHPTTWVDVQGPDLAPATRGIVRPAPIYVDSTWEDEPQ